MMTIAQWIKTNRERLGYSQTELGALIGCSQQRLQNYEKDKRCPDLELLVEFARFFGSELKIGIEGIQILSGTDTTYLETGSLSALLASSVQDESLIAVAQAKFKAEIQPYLEGIHSPHVSFKWGNHRLTARDFQQILQQDTYLASLGAELEELVQGVIFADEDVDEVFSPHAFGGLGQYSCNLMFGEEGLDASLNLSLYREALEGSQTTSDWYWYLYSEIDGEVDKLSTSYPVETVSGVEILHCFVELMNDFLALDPIQTLIRDYCKAQLIA